MYFKMVQHPLKLLKDPGLFWEFYIKQFVKICRYKITNTKKQTGKICGRKIATPEETNSLIYQGLVSDKPFMVGRIGGVETELLIKNKMLSLGAIDDLTKSAMKKGKDSAGIFPENREVFEKFANVYSSSMGEADLTVYWGHILCEAYALKKYYPDSQLIPSRPLEPFGFKKPWISALAGKKVLIIHPFEKTILSQYEKRDKLFKNPDILPMFELKTLKAVQSLGDRDCGFDSWDEALEFMKKEINKIDFDVAILGCGGYAMPLAAYIKELGKKAVVLGGMTQLLFGIKGARWEASRPDIVALYNDYWVRPEQSEKPEGFERTENGAYW